VKIPQHGDTRFVRSTEYKGKELTNKMPTTETPVRLTEQELVEQWRAEELERAGYPPLAAVELAGRADVDLHRAAELIKSGCTPELALQILL
jgi:hypothetical protein